MRLPQYFNNLLSNIRFYILAMTFVVSIAVVSWLQLTIASDQLFYIRLQQVYGLLAVVLLYGAILLTPLSKIVRNKSRLSVALFSRRAIGVSAAYFAILHTVIAVLDQVGGLANLMLLPDRFKLAFLLGGIALLILIIMAATSFDAVIKKLTFKRWKAIHSYVYLAGVLIIVHVWLIGTHSDITGIRIASAAALAVLFALESNRIVAKIAARFKFSSIQTIASGLAIFAVLFGSLWLLPLFAGNYHSQHEDESNYTTEEVQ